MAEVYSSITNTALTSNEEEIDLTPMDIGRRLVQDEKDVYEVEAITGMKELNGKMYYKVRWTGYHAKESTWEPQENLLTCMDMVETYVQSKLAKQKAKQESLEANDKPSPPKDTFWKDFEEGKINVFEQDMYSRVKKARSYKEKKLPDSTQTNSNSSLNQSKEAVKKGNSLRKRQNMLQSNTMVKIHRRKNNKMKKHILMKSPHNLTIPNSPTNDSVLLYNHLREYEPLQNCSSKNDPNDTSLLTKYLKRHKSKDRDMSHLLGSERLLQKTKKGFREKTNENDWSLNCSVLVENLKLSNIPLNFSPDGRMLIQEVDGGCKVIVRDVNARLSSSEALVTSEDEDLELHQVKENKNDADIVERPVTKETVKSASSYPITSSSKFCIGVKNGDHKKIQKIQDIIWHDEQVLNSTITPLVFAVLKGNTEEAKSLINRGEDVNMQLKSGYTALMLASEQGDVKMVLALLELGAQKELKNNKGETALIMASRQGHFNVVKQLLDHGANFSVSNNEGMTALRVSAASAQTAVHNLLNNHITRIKYAFEAFIDKLLKDSCCKVLHALFPLHCFTLNEGPDLYITFCHGVPSEIQGTGDLIFITYLSVSGQEVTCFMSEPCFVLSVTLNGVQQSAMTEGTNFVLSFKPLQYGTNEAVIHTVPSPRNKNFKLVVCAFRTELEKLPNAE